MMNTIGKLVGFLIKLPKRLFDVLLGVVCTALGLLVHPAVAAIVSGTALYLDKPWYLVLTWPFVLGVCAVLMADKSSGQVPCWAGAWATPDEPLPGDLLEPTVKKVYDKYGWRVCSLYWLLSRNRMMGLAFAAGRYLPDGKQLDGGKWGYQELPNGAWRLVLNLGIVQLGLGNQTTLKKGEGIYAIPWFTIKRVKGSKP